MEKEGKPRVYHNRESKVKEALVHNDKEPDFWTQYNRTHGLLGSIRGNGAPLRDYPSRQAYNIFTGIFEISNKCFFFEKAHYLKKKNYIKGEKLEQPSWSMNGNYKLVSNYQRNLSKSNNILD